VRAGVSGPGATAYRRSIQTPSLIVVPSRMPAKNDEQTMHAETSTCDAWLAPEIFGILRGGV